MLATRFPAQVGCRNKRVDRANEPTSDGSVGFFCGDLRFSNFPSSFSISDQCAGPLGNCRSLGRFSEATCPPENSLIKNSSTGDRRRGYPEKPFLPRLTPRINCALEHPLRRITIWRMKIAPSVAYHEAGHAALAIYLRIGLKRVSVIPGNDYSGTCDPVRQPSLTTADHGQSDYLTKRVEKCMMVALAGAEAQRKFAPTSVRHYQARGDIKAVFELAFRLCGSSEEASALVKLLQIRTRNILGVDYVWRGVKALAKQLLKQREIKGTNARVIIESAAIPRRRSKIETITYSVETAPESLASLASALKNEALNRKARGV